jgi:outer membrane protein insertion porin family
VTIEKTPGADNKMDVRIRLEEQNRNQLTFGAGVSQFEGFFGQLAFQTSNFLGRGESLTLSLQGGSRAQTYNVSFTEPFLFDRNVTAGASVFRNEVRYTGQFTQKSAGVSTTFGFPVGTGFTRAYVNYSYERVHVTDVSEFYTDDVLNRNPWLRDSLLITQGGERIVSKVVPAIVYNTIDHPVFPTRGTRLSGSIDLAGLGGNTRFYKPRLEGIRWFRQNSRMTLGLRAQWEYVQSFGSTIELPIFERLFLGGEYSVRGFDLRTIAPQDESGLLIGGNKSLLFNVEQVFTIAQPVRLILFYDAGQVQPGSQRITDDLVIPGQNFSLDDFKTSTGAEIRFFMPVLNVPFRLIFAMNPQREGVLDNTLQPTPFYRFRFAVGTTF